MNEKEKHALEQLTAVVNTLISAIEAIFETHPDPGALATAFLSPVEKDNVRELWQPSPDATFVIAKQLRQALLLSLRRRLAPEGLPPK